MKRWREAETQTESSAQTEVMELKKKILIGK
jgi:hypothetical protein